MPNFNHLPSPDLPPRSGAFAPTRWTLVLRAGGRDAEGRAALADLCETYWQPVFRFLRREGRTEDAARELTQEFFARLLSAGNIGGADPAQGRFRSYLLGAVKHFLRDQRDFETRRKRGGGHLPEPLPDEHSETENGTTAPPGNRAANPTLPPPDALFDREWALLILDRALTKLGNEMAATGAATSFALLKPWLTGASTAHTQAEAARLLGLSDGAMRVTIHRLRQRFRQVVREGIAATVSHKDEVDAEVRYLVEVLSV